MELHFIGPGHPRYAGELDLRFRVLREPLGFTRDDVVFPMEDDSMHLVAVEGERVVGCVLFAPSGTTGRLYQMAVDPGLQKQGLGSRLVERLEEELRGRGFDEVTLHARDVAVPFYERLGYTIYGEPFEEVRVPHHHMRKQL